jgi:serine/threonine-protein phosphatase 2A regulatory subunit A
LVGGKEYIHTLLPLIETLAAVEETVVRDAAIQSFAMVVEKMDRVEEFATVVVKRLSSGDWFTSRTSACGMYTPVYPFLSNKGIAL